MLTQDDFSLPEDIRLNCGNGHDVTNDTCVQCSRAFMDIFSQGDQVACGVYLANNGHICSDCWRDLPEGDTDA